MWLATWNVNSVRVRLPRLLAFLRRSTPDIVCLQETKVVDDLFPHEAFSSAGYHSVVHGQPGYNGVAILAREPLREVTRGFADGSEEDKPSRLITATYRGCRVMSAYLPNGKEMGTDAAAYKTDFYRRLTRKLAPWGASQAKAVVAGDFNIAPGEGDVYDPERWAPTVHFHPEMRALLHDLMAQGFTDAFAKLHPEGGVYSWWDYRSNNFDRNRGLRIDLVLANESLATGLVEAHIDKDERRGEKPSDHVPVLAHFKGV